MFSKRFFKTKDEVEVTFEVIRPEASTAEWVSETSDWYPVEMRRSKKSGPFKLKVRLPKDRHVQFRYRFDGDEWENDEAADAYWPTDRGVDNSVVYTG
jgi:1,4-alpha-glucan branching enzyme